MYYPSIATMRFLTFPMESIFLKEVLKLSLFFGNKENNKGHIFRSNYAARERMKIFESPKCCQFGAVIGITDD